MVKKASSKKAVKVQKTAKPVDDFVFTIDSDVENDIPDLDTSDEEKGDEEAVVPKTEKKKKGKKLKSKETSKEDEDEEVAGKLSKDLDPNFVFSLEGMETVSNFDGWDFQLEEKEENGVKKDVDLDNILRRKGGLGLIAKTKKEEEEEDAEVEEEEEEEEEEEDDELAMDGFGMGAKNAVIEGDEDEDEEEDDDEEEEEEEKEEEDNDEVELNFKNDKSKLDEEPEDTAEQIAEFYADEEENELTKKQIHTTFQTLSLSRPVLKGLSQLGYTKPSPIQSASIPVALLGKDIVAGAVTGSGKTAAYMIPIIERLLYKPAKIASTRVVVLAPTRELAIQVADVGKKIGHFVNGLSFGLAVGGLNLRQQEQELKTRPDIVIATPGRFIDHIRNSPSFNVDSVEVLVVDEADRMLEEGFLQELTEILSLLPRKRQTLLFSATMNSKIKQLIQLSLDKPVRIMIDPPKQAATGLVQEFVRIRKREALKPSLLFNLLKKIDSRQQNRVVVFVSRKEMAHRLRIILGLLGLKVSELHGSLSQEQRLKSVTDFKKLTVPVLICTDLAARGLDIPKIEYVINFDMPKSFEIYLHRVGRTARAGREGKSISFVGEAAQDRAIVKELIKSVELNKSGKAVGRNVDWNEVEEINKHIESKQEVVEEVLQEEKHEKEILQAEMQLKKGENLLKYKEEIQSRPRRTWFQTEDEKKGNGIVLSEKKKLNSKKRKVAEERELGSRSYKKTKNDRTEDQERTYAKQSHVKKDKKKKKKKFMGPKK